MNRQAAGLRRGYISLWASFIRRLDKYLVILRFFITSHLTTMVEQTEILIVFSLFLGYNFYQNRLNDISEPV